MRIFISYAKERLKEAEQVCAFLEAGGKQCWIAPRNIQAGNSYGEEIIKGIEGSDGFVLLFDKAANDSQHVLREVERAVSKKLPIVVYRLDDTLPSRSMEYFLFSIQWLDAMGLSEQSLGKLDAALDRRLAETERTESVAKVPEPVKAPEGINPHVKLSLKKTLGILAAVVAIWAVILGLGALQKSREKEKEATPTQAVDGTGAGNEAGVTPTGTEEKVSAFRVGDYVSFGSYVPGGDISENADGTIEWQVVDVNEEGTLLVATRILSIRPFDCAESGRFGWDNNGEMYDRKQKDTYTDAQMREFHGSNDWVTSDLCAWLNASGVVQYPGKTPQDAATDEYGNAHSSEAGFLTDFTKAEAELVAGSGKGVFLLTKDQVRTYALNGALNPSTTPTDAAIAADETPWYRNYKDSGATDYIWATATAVEGSASDVYHVDISLAQDTFGTKKAAAAGFGIRPALCISVADGSWEGDGSRQNPYRMTE